MPGGDWSACQRTLPEFAGAVCGCLKYRHAGVADPSRKRVAAAQGLNPDLRRRVLQRGGFIVVKQKGLSE